MILLILEAPLILSEFPKTYFLPVLNTVIAHCTGKCLWHENSHCMICLGSISTKECIELIPVLWYYWILKEPQTVHVWKIKVEQNTKQFYCIALLNAISYKKLSQWLHFQPQNHTVTASIHMLVLIYILNIEDFVVEIHHGDILFFQLHS